VSPRERAPHEGEYEIEPGVFVPRVTKILGCINKPALVGWARNTARDNTIREAGALYALAKKTTPDAFMAALKKRMTYPALTAGTEDAADLGTMLHLRVEAEMRAELGERVTIPELPEVFVDLDGTETRHPVQNAYASYLAWRQQHRVVPIRAEVRVVSRGLGYAGTVDLLASIDDRVGVVDYKTSKAIYPEYRVQVAAYRAAAVESEVVDELVPAWVARFPKTAGDSFEIEEVTLDQQPVLMAVFRAALVLWKNGFGR
jgi:hypothetical protein